MMDSYANPQHMKDVNHLLYASMGREHHFMLVWSLNCVVCNSPVGTLDFS